MYKIGVIGDKESVWGFKAVGLHTQACEAAKKPQTPCIAWQKRSMRLSILQKACARS